MLEWPWARPDARAAATLDARDTLALGIAVYLHS